MTVTDPRVAGLSDACADCPLVTVLVCRKCKGSDKVVDFLAKQNRVSVTTVRCQKVCEGPVAGIAIRGRMEWFGKMNGSKALNALAGLTKAGTPKKLPKTLRKRIDHDRSGRCR